MNGPELLDIPLLGTMIAEETEHFSQDRNLRCDPWYHGSPMWLIGERGRRDEDFFRQVDIAVYRTHKGEHFYLMPQGLKWKGDKWAVTRPDVEIAYPLRELLPVNEDTRKKLQVLIAYGWLVAELLQESDLTTQ